MTIRVSRRAALAGGLAAFATPSVIAFSGSARAQGAAPAPVTSYVRNVGELKLTAISDGFFEVSPGFFVNITPEELKAAEAAAFIDPAKPQRLGVTAHLVQRRWPHDADRHRRRRSSSGPRSAASSRRWRPLASRRSRSTLSCSRTCIPITSAGLLTDGAASFPKATVHVAGDDLDFWTDEAIAGKAPDGMKPFFARERRDRGRLRRSRRSVQRRRGDSARRHRPWRFRAIPSATPATGWPRAAPRSSSLAMPQARRRCSSPIPTPDSSSTPTPPQAAASRRRLFDMAATDRTLVAGTHLPFPGIGHVVRSGDAYAWEAGGVAVHVAHAPDATPTTSSARQPPPACATRAKARGPARRAMPSLALVVSCAPARPL